MLSEKVAKEYKLETAPLNLEIAKHFNRMATLKGDRDPDSPKGKMRVAYLYDLLRAGLFHSPIWSTVNVTSEKGKIHRVDGGHSARMLTQAGPDFPENLSVTIRRFRASDIDAAIDLYEQFNQRISTRTKTDLVKNRAAYEPKLKGISPTNISSAMWGILCHYQLRNPSEDFEALDFIRLHPEFISWSAEFVRSRRLRKAGVVGAMFSTWNFSKTLANDFWLKVRDETALTPKCPTRFLSKFLVSTYLDKSRLAQWPKRAIYVKCHHAWVAWRNNTTTALKYIEGAPLPNPK